jgi:hypothetical protein
MVSRVWTVELSDDYRSKAILNLAGMDGIEFLAGSSDAVLSELAPTLERPLIYWLDAHWCELGTAGEDAQCPVIAEIAAIDRSPGGADSAILIDDARFFLGSPSPTYRRADWPTFMEVADALRVNHPRYVSALSDVIIAVPERGRVLVEEWYGEQMFIDLRDQRDTADVERQQALADRDRLLAALSSAGNPSVGRAVAQLIKAALPERARAHLRRQS